MYFIDVTFTGEVVDEIHITHDAAGIKHARFIVVHTPAYYDEVEKQWMLSEQNEIHCVARMGTADVIDESVNSGDLVLIYGTMRLKNVYDDEGRIIDQVNEVVIKDIGHSLVAQSMR